MKHLWPLRLFAGLALSLSLSAAELKIAYLDGLSGPFANVGEAGLMHLTKAVEQINAKGGVLGHKLNLLAFDNKGSAQESLIQLQAITDQGIGFVLHGNSSAIAHALVEAIEKWNERNPQRALLYLNYAAIDPELTNSKCSFWHFRFDANTAMRMDVLSDYIAREKQIKRVYLLNQDYTHGHQVAAIARQMLLAKRPDIRIVGEELHPLGKVRDFTPYMEKIRLSEADAVISGNWGNDLSLLVRSARDAQWGGKFFTFYAGNWGTVSALGQAGQGRVFQVSEWHPNVPLRYSRAFAEQLNRDYAERFPDLPPTFYFMRFNTLLAMLTKAITTAGSTDPYRVALALEGARHDSDTGGVWMRPSDHQLMQPLLVSQLVKAGHGLIELENSGSSFSTVLSRSSEQSVQKSTCQMKRPAGR